MTREKCVLKFCFSFQLLFYNIFMFYEDYISLSFIFILRSCLWSQDTPASWLITVRDSNGSFLRAAPSCINTHIRQPLTGNLATWRHSVGVVINTRAICRYHCSLLDIAFPWQHNSTFFFTLPGRLWFSSDLDLTGDWDFANEMKNMFKFKPRQMHDGGLHKPWVIRAYRLWVQK